MGSICEFATSAPGYSSVLPEDKTPLAMTLKLNGYGFLGVAVTRVATEGSDARSGEEIDTPSGQTIHRTHNLDLAVLFQAS